MSGKFEEQEAQVLGLSADPKATLKAWAASLGSVTHPLLSDFWPHGKTLQAYGVFNEQSGGARRSLFIIDPQGIIRHKEEHQGTLPDPQGILDLLSDLKKAG
jgi:peroxiredoxin